jgi:hypothetical protein
MEKAAPVSTRKRLFERMSVTCSNWPGAMAFNCPRQGRYPSPIAGLLTLVGILTKPPVFVADARRHASLPGSLGLRGVGGTTTAALAAATAATSLPPRAGPIALPHRHHCRSVSRDREVKSRRNGGNRRGLPMQRPQGVGLFRQQLGVLVVHSGKQDPDLTRQPLKEKTGE